MNNFKSEPMPSRNLLDAPQGSVSSSGEQFTNGDSWEATFQCLECGEKGITASGQSAHNAEHTKPMNNLDAAVMTRGEISNKAFRVVGGGMPAIAAASTRGKASYAAFRGAREAGYTFGFESIKVTRAPEFDHWARTVKDGACYTPEYVEREAADLAQKENR